MRILDRGHQGQQSSPDLRVREEGDAVREIRRVRKEVRSTVASFTDSSQYTIDQLIEQIVQRLWFSY